MTRLGYAAAALLVAHGAFAQAPAGTVEVTADGCKMYLPQGEARGASRIRWSGKCTDGFADGRGIVRIYSGGKISRVSEGTFGAGKLAGTGESYFVRGGQAIRNRGGDQLEIAAAELPTWALELSMLVEDRPRPAARPAPVAKTPPPPAPKVDKEAEERRLAAEKAKEAEAQRLRAEAKAAADKLAAEKAAERQRALAEAKAAAERAALAQKLAAEKRAAEKAAQDAERQRQQAEQERALAEAKAAAERAAEAEKLAAEKAAEEAERQRQQAEKERVLAQAKLAAEKAAQEAERQRQQAEKERALAEAKAAAEKPRWSFVPGRGFSDSASGAPLRGVVTFKLTTPEGRDFGVATFVAGNGEAEIRQNANALASVYEKVSPFKARLLDQPQVAQMCGGPGYVIEARVTYPSAKGYGWYAGCMGESLEQAAKSMQQLENQMHRDYKVTPTSFWAYQYLIVGYVDDKSFRGRDQYEQVAKSGMMAPGRVMVLTTAQQWAECTTVVNKDPKLKDKLACLREAVDKLKSTLGLR